MRAIYLFVFIVSFGMADQAVDVLIANKDIKYKSIITIDDVFEKKVSTIKRNCIPLERQDLIKLKFITKHYIRSGNIICIKDVKVDSGNSVLFNFGTIEIERRGKVIFENSKYIKIKRPDGKIEKILKDGSDI